MIEIPTAHAGHWLVSLVYALPVAILIVIVGWDAWRRRRRGERPDEDAPGTGSS